MSFHTMALKVSCTAFAFGILALALVIVMVGWPFSA